MHRTTILLSFALVVAGCSGDAEVASTSADSTVVPESSAATAAPEVRTFVGADGVESEISDVSRIVPLSGDLTEAVYALGLGDNVVGRDVTTIYPPEAMTVPIVGLGRFLTAEGVLAENPTLVLGDTQTAPLEAIEQIRDAGVPVFIFDVPTSFEGLYEKARQIGDVLGAPGEGAALAAEMQTSIEAAVATATPLDPTPGVAFIYSRGPDVMLLFGDGMVTGPLIEASGGRDVGAELGVTGTVDVTPEAIVAAAPDVIVTTQEGIDAFGGVDGFLAVPGIAETPAGRAGRVIAYSEGDFLTLGPRIGDQLQRFIADLRDALGDP